MKRFLIILLAIQILLLTSCTLPFIGDNTSPSGVAEDQQMLNVKEDTASNGVTASAVNGTQAAISSGSGILLTGGAVLTTGLTETSIISSIATDAAGNVTGSSAASDAQNSSVAGIDLTKPVSSDSLTGAPTAAGIQVVPQSSDITETRRPVTVYYQDGDGYLIPMTRWIPQQSGIARAAVSFIIDSPMAREEITYYGVYPVLPDNTSVLGIDIKDGIASVDFNSYFLDYSNEASERNIVASVVYTLTEFKTVSKVRFLVNGCPQGAMKYGTDVSQPLGRADIAINANNSILKSGSAKVDVFLLKKANEGFTYMAPTSVPVTYNAAGAEKTIPDMLVKQLLLKAEDGRLYTEIPKNTELLKLDRLDDLITLDFNKSLLDYGGNSREEGILKQIAYTLRQTDGVKRLRILVEGRETQLPEGTDISGGLAIPATINDVMDR